MPYIQNRCILFFFPQGPAELPSDWGKHPDGPEEEKLNQRQASIGSVTRMFLLVSEVRVFVPGALLLKKMSRLGTPKQ